MGDTERDWAAFESAIIDALEVPMERKGGDGAANGDGWADAVTTERIEDPHPTLRTVRSGAGSRFIPTGTDIEIKTCQRWVDDNGSNGGRRRGRWQFWSKAHDRLFDRGGAYLSIVLDGGTVLDARIVDAMLVSGWLSSWWESDDPRGRSSQLCWRAVVPPETLDDNPTGVQLEVEDDE